MIQMVCKRQMRTVFKKFFLYPEIKGVSKIGKESMLGWLLLGSLVSKDGRSDISQILMPSPYPTAGLCPKTLHLDLVFPLPEGDLIQVLPAVSFRKRERYRLSYRGWAESMLVRACTWLPSRPSPWPPPPPPWRSPRPSWPPPALRGGRRRGTGGRRSPRTCRGLEKNTKRTFSKGAK